MPIKCSFLFLDERNYPVMYTLKNYAIFVFLSFVLDNVLSKALAAPSLVDLHHLCSFGRGHNEEHFCEIILNLN